MREKASHDFLRSLRLRYLSNLQKLLRFSIFDELRRLMLRLDLMKNQRHNISEDTWRQVLAFSRCVHENLEGYDPEGLKLYPGSLKRKSHEDSIRHELELSDSRFCDSIDLNDGKSNPKRIKRRFITSSRQGGAAANSMETVKQSLLSSSKSSCAVKGICRALFDDRVHLFFHCKSSRKFV